MNKWREENLRVIPLSVGDRFTLVLVGLEGLAIWLFPHPNV